jgi:hypothetical protein
MVDPCSPKGKTRGEEGGGTPGPGQGGACARSTRPLIPSVRKRTPPVSSPGNLLADALHMNLKKNHSGAPPRTRPVLAPPSNEEIALSTGIRPRPSLSSCRKLTCIRCPQLSSRCSPEPPPPRRSRTARGLLLPSSRCVHSTSISLSPSPLSLSLSHTHTLSHTLTLFLSLISLVSPRFEEQALEGEAAAAEPAAAEGGEQPAGTGKELVKSVTEAITEKPTEANSHYIKGYNDKVCVFDSMLFSSPTDS